MNPSIESHRRRIDSAFDLAEKVDPSNNELRSHLARYLCILVSGFLERSVCHIVDEFARTRSPPSVYRYVASQQKKFQNAKTAKIITLIGQFDRNWADEFARNIDGEIKDGTDSVVSTRHQIAHGENTGITLATMKAYYKSVNKLITLLEARFS